MYLWVMTDAIVNHRMAEEACFCKGGSHSTDDEVYQCLSNHT